MQLQTTIQTTSWWESAVPRSLCCRCLFIIDLCFLSQNEPTFYTEDGVPFTAADPGETQMERKVTCDFFFDISTYPFLGSSPKTLKKTPTIFFFKTKLVFFFVFFYFFSAEYAEKYQEMLARQDYFHDTYGENGNEAWVQDRVMLVHGWSLMWIVVFHWETLQSNHHRVAVAFRLWPVHLSVGSYSLEVSSDSTKSFLVWPQSDLTCLWAPELPNRPTVQQWQPCPQIQCGQQLVWKRAESPPSLSLLHKPSFSSFWIFQKGGLVELKLCLSPAGTMTLKTSWSPTCSKILRVSVWRQRGNDNNDPTIRIPAGLTGAAAFGWSPAGTLKDKVFDNSSSYQKQAFISQQLYILLTCLYVSFYWRSRITWKIFFPLGEDMGASCWIPLFSPGEGAVIFFFLSLPQISTWSTPVGSSFSLFSPSAH